MQKILIILTIIILGHDSKAVTKDNTRYKMYFDTAMVFFKMADYEKARKCFDAASRCNDKPDNDNAEVWRDKSLACRLHTDTADIFLQNEEYCHAYIHYEIVCKLNKFDKKCRKQMTYCLENTDFKNQNMVKIKGGTFSMGNNNGPFNEQPAHDVLVETFYIDKYEVSNYEYVTFLNIKGLYNDAGRLRIDLNNPDCKIYVENGWFKVKEGYEFYPVVTVSWYGADDYAQWCGKSLPTEAQWEYAFADSKNLDRNEIISVYSCKPNKYGIYGMSGNVWEWCSDWYFENIYRMNHQFVINDSEYKVIRGGAYISPSEAFGATHRNYNFPDKCRKTIGFRCVKNI